MFEIGEFITRKPNIERYVYTNSNSICEVVKHNKDGTIRVRIVGYKKPTNLDYAIGDEYSVDPTDFMQTSARMK